MGLLDLLRPPPRTARIAAGDTSLLARLRDAVAKPPMPNRYVAPRLRTVDAVLFTLRGYHVKWTPGTYENDGVSSVLVYFNAFEKQTWNPYAGTLVELPTIIPGEIARAVSWMQGARTVGIRFAWWQVKRELPWILQRRRSKR